MVSNLNLLESRRRILLNTPHIKTVSDTIASFETDVATKIKGCKIHFTPIQEGEDDPSPENVRPIHGWDGVTVTACGKNLAPPLSNTDFWSIKAWFDVDGIIHSNTGYIMCDYQKALPNTTYHLSSSNNVWKAIGFYDGLYKPIGYKQGTSNRILISPSNAKYFRVYVAISSKDIQLELGSESTDYEPYTATTLTIPFNRTIYGGYVDLVKGEVVETDGIKLGNELNWNIGDSVNTKDVFETTDMTGKARVSGINSICSVYNVVNANTLAANMGDKTCKGSSVVGKAAYYYVKDSDYANNLEDFAESISDVQFVYKLTTPNTYSIDPQTLKALRGMNNIWSDANGNIEVSFYTH